MRKFDDTHIYRTYSQDEHDTAEHSARGQTAPNLRASGKIYKDALFATVCICARDPEDLFTVDTFLCATAAPYTAWK